MKIQGLFFTSILLISLGCTNLSNKQRVANSIENVSNVEVFLLPRRCDFLPASDGNIWQYCSYFFSSDHLIENTHYLAFQNRGYHCLTQKDTVSQYFYTRVFDNYKLFEQIEGISAENSQSAVDEVVMGVVRIYSRGGDFQELYLCQSGEILFNSRYVLNKVLILNEILNIAPIEIRENWVNNLGAISDMPPNFKLEFDMDSISNGD